MTAPSLQKKQLVVSLLSLFSIVEKLSSNWYSGWCLHAIAILTTAMIQKSFSRHIVKLTTNQARQNMNKLNSRTFLFNSMMKGSLVTLVTCSDVTSSVSLCSFLFNSMMKGSLVTLVTCSDVTSSVSLYSFLFNSMMKGSLVTLVL